MLFNGAKVKNFTLAPWGDQRVFTVILNTVNSDSALNNLCVGKCKCDR